MAKALIGRDGRTIMQVVDNGREFPVHPSLRWIDAPENVDTSWIYDGSRFALPLLPEPPAPPVPSVIGRLIAALERKGVLEPGEIEER